MLCTQINSTKMKNQSTSNFSVYKYLKREYAQKMMKDGSIQIGTLSHYRDIEDEARADRNEGKKAIVTIIEEDISIKNSEDWNKELGFLNGTNVQYIRGNVEVPKNTVFSKKEDIPDAYIYCTSKKFSEDLMTKFDAECCIEIFNVQHFLNVVTNKLSELKLIYPTLGSGREIVYLGHTVGHENKISGNWIKDAEPYKEEAEFRFSFVPIHRKNGVIVQPIIDKDGNATFPSDVDKIILKAQKIHCPELIKCCRWKIR